MKGNPKRKTCPFRYNQEKGAALNDFLKQQSICNICFAPLVQGEQRHGPDICVVKKQWRKVIGHFRPKNLTFDQYVKLIHAMEESFHVFLSKIRCYVRTN